MRIFETPQERAQNEKKMKIEGVLISSCAVFGRQKNRIKKVIIRPRLAVNPRPHHRRVAFAFYTIDQRSTIPARVPTAVINPRGGRFCSPCDRIALQRPWVVIATGWKQFS